MKTHWLAHRWQERKSEWGLWWGFGGLLLLPTAINLAFWLLPLWIVIGLSLLWLFCSSLAALTKRDQEQRPAHVKAGRS